MKTVKITLKDGESNYWTEDLPLNAIIKVDSSFVDISNFLDDNELDVLMQLEHNQPITKLNLTNVTPYVLLCFDNALHFRGASYSIKNGTGPFTIETQFKNLLFLRMPHNLNLNQIINLTL
jgi:hypothetical protein